MRFVVLPYFRHWGLSSLPTIAGFRWVNARAKGLLDGR